MKCHSKFELDIIELFKEEYVCAEMCGIRLFFAGHIPEEAFEIVKNQNSTMKYFGQNLLFFISFPTPETKQGIVFTTEGFAWKVADGNSFKISEGGIQYFSLAIQGGRNYSRVPAILPIKIIYRCMKEYTSDLDDDDYPTESTILENYYSSKYLASKNSYCDEVDKNDFIADVDVIGFGIAEGKNALNNALMRMVCNSMVWKQLTSARSLMVTVFGQPDEHEITSVYSEIMDIAGENATITLQSLPGSGLKEDQVAVSLSGVF